ncbi:NUDIX hydrolase [Rhodobacterales bacterium 59_46_T64]|mgnify:CR=1 FL=1|nr:NUDIX hydrolase [Rhodobacterales bacterium 59_46_T64]
MIRRFGEAPETGRNYIHRPGVYAVLAQGADVLLTHQSKPFPDLQLPGGGIDPGESPLQALYREVLEETGFSIDRPRRIGAFRRFTFMPDYEIWAEKLCTVYIARPVRQIHEPTEPGHLAIWMPARLAACELGNAGDRHFLASLLL